MDVTIGVTHTPKEIQIPLPDDADPDAIRKQVEKAVTGGDMLWLTDKRGRQIGVPTENLAYIEVSSAKDDRRIGFGG